MSHHAALLRGAALAALLAFASGPAGAAEKGTAGPKLDSRAIARAIDQFGVKRAQRMLGLKIHTPGTPAAEALAEAAQRYHLCAIRLTVRT